MLENFSNKINIIFINLPYIITKHHLTVLIGEILCMVFSHLDINFWYLMLNNSNFNVIAN